MIFESRHHRMRASSMQLSSSIKQVYGVETSVLDLKSSDIRARQTSPAKAEVLLTLSKVFVLDTNKQPLDFCHPGQARRLLNSGLAAIYRRFPFTIILKREVSAPELQSYRIKIDPGSKKTGIVIVNERTGEV